MLPLRFAWLANAWVKALSPILSCGWSVCLLAASIGAVLFDAFLSEGSGFAVVGAVSVGGALLVAWEADGDSVGAPRLSVGWVQFSVVGGLSRGCATSQ